MLLTFLFSVLTNLCLEGGKSPSVLRFPNSSKILLVTGRWFEPELETEFICFARQYVPFAMFGSCLLMPPQPSASKFIYPPKFKQNGQFPFKNGLLACLYDVVNRK